MVLKKIIRKPLTGGYKNLKTELFEEKINEDITERELRQNQEVLVNNEEIIPQESTNKDNIIMEKKEELNGLEKVDDENIMEAYETIGKKIGAMRNGEVDYERVSTKIINDIKLEKIKGITFDRK